MSPFSLRSSLRRPRRARPCARAHTWPVPAALAAALLLGLAACDEDRAKASSAKASSAEKGSAATAAASASIPPAQRERLDALIEAMTPLRADLTSDHHDRHLHEGRALLEELKQADESLGRAAWRVYTEQAHEVDAVRRGLLTVAAHTATEETAPELESLILEYGPPLADRALAIDLLAETDPERAIGVFEPLLKKKKQRSTMPDDEFFVRGYIVACERADHDPAPILADVATNFFKQPVARYFAAEELGNHPGKVSWNALRQILVESTGDQYLRRKAAQAIRESVPAETACEVFEEVLRKEADLFFAEFLLDMIEDNCP